MDPIEIITPEELKQKLEAGEKLELVDVREDEEVAEGMIPGAKHIRMRDIPANLEYFDRNKEYIIICRSGSEVKMFVIICEIKGIKSAIWSVECLVGEEKWNNFSILKATNYEQSLSKMMKRHLHMSQKYSGLLINHCLFCF